MLVRRAGKVFKHVEEVLRQTQLSAGIFADYTTVLKILLGVPAYRTAATMSDMAGAPHGHQGPTFHHNMARDRVYILWYGV